MDWFVLFAEITGFYVAVVLLTWWREATRKVRA